MKLEQLKLTLKKLYLEEEQEQSTNFVGRTRRHKKLGELNFVGLRT